MKPLLIPMNPSDLQALGVLDKLDLATSNQRTYAIWHIPCFSVADGASRAIRQLGFAEVLLEPAGSGELLTVHQHLMYEHWGRLVGACDFHFSATCRDDALRSLVDWTLTTRFTTWDGTEPFPSWTERGTTEGGAFRIERDGQTESHPAETPWQADLGLLATIPGLAPDVRHPCNVYNMDGTCFEAQWIEQAGELKEANVFGGMGHLRRFSRWGHGCAPWNYWVDENGRTVMAASNSTVYLVDEQATEHCEWQRQAGVYKTFAGRNT